MSKTKVTLETNAKDWKNRQYSFSIEFYVFDDAGTFIAYCPALDLTTTGKDFNDAILNFHECFQLHIEECVASGTLLQDLREHGWKIRTNTISPPPFSKLIKKPEMKRIIYGSLGYEKVVSPAKLCAFV